jgi:hypothetical protein
MDRSFRVYETALTDETRQQVDALVGHNIMAGPDHMSALAEALNIRMRQARAQEDLPALLFCMAAIERLSFAASAEIAIDSGRGGNA